MPYVFNVITIVLNTFGFFCSMFFIIKSLFYYKLRSLHTENRLVILMSISTMILFAITTLISATGYILNVTVYSHLRVWPHLYAAITWRCAQMLAYSLFITRFKQSFQTTKYDVSKYVYCSLYFGAILFILVYILYFVLSKILKIEEFTDFYGWIINAILSIIINLILSISILIVFTKRLWTLTIDLAIRKKKELSVRKISLSYSMSVASELLLQKKQPNYDNVIDENEPNDNDWSDKKEDSSIQLNHRQLNVIDALSKIVVLSLISIISFQISMVIEIVCAVVFMHNPWFGYDIFWCYIAIDSIINSLMVFLSFDSFYQSYYLLCGPFDRCCTICCEQHTKKKIKLWENVNVQA